jgi:hypothetical protein
MSLYCCTHCGYYFDSDQVDYHADAEGKDMCEDCFNELEREKDE